MRKTYETVDGIMKKVSNVCVTVSAAVLFIIAAIIFVDVAMRYVFNHAIKGQQELAEMATVLVVYFGLPFATRIRSHVRVEPVTDKLKPHVKSYLYGVLDFVVVIFMALLTVKVFQQALFLTTTPGNATLVLRIPWFYTYFAASLGGLISTVEFVLDGIRYCIEGKQLAVEAKGGEIA